MDKAATHPTAVRRARRWFWALTATAVLAAGGLDHGLRSAPGPGTGMLTLVSALVLTASVVQAARILTVLTKPPRLPRWLRPGGHPGDGRERDTTGPALTDPPAPSR